MVSCWSSLCPSVCLHIGQVHSEVCVCINCPAFANSVDPDQFASQKPTDLDLYCFSLSMWNLFQQPGSSNLIC